MSTSRRYQLSDWGRSSRFAQKADGEHARRGNRSRTGIPIRDPRACHLQHARGPFRVSGSFLSGRKMPS